MRKLAAALLAVPVLALLYVPVLVRRSVAARIGLAIGVGGLVAIGALGLITTRAHDRDAAAAADRPARRDRVHVDDRGRTRSSTRPFELAFSAPMDQRSVAAALEVSPADGRRASLGRDRHAR